MGASGGVPIVWEPMRLRLRLLSQEFRKKIYALAASCSSVGGEGVKIAPRCERTNGEEGGNKRRKRGERE